MSLDINKLFIKDKLTEQQLVYCKAQFIKIGENFKNNLFDFNKLKTDDLFLLVLQKYFDFYGYGYLEKQIKQLKDSNSLDSINLSKLLINSNLITKPSKALECSIKDKEVIAYKKEFGLTETIHIDFKLGSFPFKIYNIDYTNKEFVNCEINKSFNGVKVEVSISKDQEINFTEILVIYTTYGTEKVEFTIKCDAKKETSIPLKNYEEFLKLCKANRKDAMGIFFNDEFITWLEKKRYYSQVLNYNEAISLAASDKLKAYDIFCALNLIFIKANSNNDNETSIIMKENNSSEEFLDIKDCTIVVDEKKSEHNLDVDAIISNDKKDQKITEEVHYQEENQSKGKGLFSWIKSKFSRPNRK